MKQPFIYQIHHRFLHMLLGSTLSFLGGCGGLEGKDVNAQKTEEGMEITLLNATQNRILVPVPGTLIQPTEKSVSQSKKKEIEATGEKPMDEFTTISISTQEASSLFFDSTLSEKNPSFNPPSETQIEKIKVSEEKWKELSEILLGEGFAILKSEILRTLETRHVPGNPDGAHKLYKLVFDEYYKLYHLFTIGKPDNILKQFKKNWKESILTPLGHFVALFEILYGKLRNDYIKNLGKNDTSPYPKQLEKLRKLENEILPTIQQTFNTFMKIYEKHTSEELGEIGPIKCEGKNFFVHIEYATRYIFYKRDKAGIYSLFTLTPHENNKIGENLYRDCISYTKLSDAPSRKGDCVIIFSLNRAQEPVINDHPGLFLKKDENDYLLISHLSGNTTSLPYETSLTITIPTTSIRNRELDRMQEALGFFNEEKSTEDPAKREEILDYMQDVLPAQAQEGGVLADIKKVCLTPTQINVIAELTNLVDENLVKGSNGVFIPFPYTDIEEREATYLYLLDLKQRVQEGNIQPADIKLLHYLGHEDFSEPELGQIIEEYEKELVDDYAKEEEEKIRLEQEARSRMVASGELHQKPTKLKKPQQKKRGGTSQKTKENHIKQNTSMKSEVEKQVNEDSSSTGKLPKGPKEKAGKKLEELKKSNKNGSVKFRKFMQLVNIARQGLTELDLTTTAELHKSSHGTIQMEGANPQTIVRPHGGPKGKPVSSRNKKKILTSLVKTFMEKLSKESQ